MNTYEPGCQISISCSFTTATSNTTIDPTNVKLRVIDPNGTETDYTSPAVVKVSTGNYTCALTVQTSGVWLYRWEGTGAVVTAQEGAFKVKQTVFPAD